MIFHLWLSAADGGKDGAETETSHWNRTEKTTSVCLLPVQSAEDTKEAATGVTTAFG